MNLWLSFAYVASLHLKIPLKPSLFSFLILPKQITTPSSSSLSSSSIPKKPNSYNHRMKQRMPEFKDSAAFKLFGKTISILQLSLDQEHDGASCADNEAACQDCSDRSSSNSEEEQERKVGNLLFQEPSVELIPDEKQEEGTPNQVDEDSKDPILLSVSENLKIPSAEGETSSIKSSKNGEQSDSSTSDEKNLKKPDKIIPCPRCSSMETKFCYYNNYNVNQPRHFCKNCQRYWTAGGTMRNVPVGAGRRKNKSSATAQYRHHLMVSEALRTVQAHALSVHNSSFGNNSTVLNFGSDSPLCESVASALSISHKAHSGATDWNNRPSECSVLSLNSLPKGGNDRSQEAAKIENCQGFPPQLQCFPGPAWPCPWNPTMPPPTFGPSGFPVSFYSAPRYWGYAVPDPRNTSALNHCAPVRSPTSPLGKHSRDGEVLNPGSSEELSRESNNSEKTVFVPKTLRIDDPSEAAMSSIWGTLGIKHEKSSSMNGGLFKGFQSISKEKYLTERSSLLQANPAAMSRSQNFHEIL